jgi:exoribonuclease R
MKDTYKLRIENREGSDYGLVNAYTLKDIPIPVGFVLNEYRMFNQDIFTFNNGNVNILHSSARCMKVIPAVLVLDSNKTFGRIKDKFLYKCIPDDRRLPIFLIPYKIKLGFSKNIKNKYVVFQFRKWEDKHPIGSLTQTLGDVDKLDIFYEYQLYCKSLYASIQNITKKTMLKLKEKTDDEYIELIRQNNNLKDYRENRNIFSIDPSTSKDFDDAFDVEQLEDCVRISIYISNVSFWMDAMDLWDSFSNRISTIYLPDRKRPMLPTVLSDALCSLTENDIRFALELCLIIKDGKIDTFELNNSVIKVNRNLRYDTSEQESYKDYNVLFEIVKLMNKKKKYVDSIDTSHDVVAYLMITMNYICAKELIRLNTGIFRSAKFGSNFNTPDNVPKDVKKFLKHWNSLGGKYSKDFGQHDMLDLDAYVHITSPIRRLVDLLNIMTLQDKLGLYKMSQQGKEFYERWTNNGSIEYINTTMRSLRKVQNDCNLLKICCDNIDILEEVYEGYIFDKIIRNDMLYQYMVYLPSLDMVNRFTSRHNKENLSKQKFKIFIFTDQYSLKKKIRVDLQ